MNLPFDGAITHYFKTDFPNDLRELVKKAKSKDVLSPSYPYDRWLDREPYEHDRDALQVELVKFQSWVKESGARVAILFEGRDAAGKGGSIRRFQRNLNPRGARVVALPKPSDTERSQWYFQRYIEHLPAAGEIVFFDRSWYNRAVVERVFEFSSATERELFFSQVNDFETMLVRDGIHLFKFWLTVSRAEQMRRMLARESDPLKQWKLSPIDIQSLGRWDAYTEAIAEMFERTHNNAAPWTVIRADDKRRARIGAQRAVLSAIGYHRRDREAARAPDPAIVGTPEILAAAGA